MTASSREPIAPRVSPVVRYGLAAALVGVGILMCLALRHSIYASPVSLLLLSIIASAWFGGRGPGLFATALSAVLGDVIVTGPIGSLLETAVDVARILSITVTGTVVSVLFGALQDASTRAERLAAERAGAIAELGVQRARMAALLEHMPAGAVYADAEGRIVLGNAKVEEILGHPVIHNPDLPSVRRYAALHATEDRPLALDEYPLVRALRGETHTGQQIRYRRSDGRIVWLRVSGAPIRDAGGRITGAVDLFWNIDEEKQGEEALRATELRLDVALAAARLGAWHIDVRTMRLDASATCKANFGRGPDERFDYADLLDSLVPEDRTVLENAVARSLKDHDDYTAEYRIVWPDGSIHWIAARGRATYAADGTPLAMDGVTQDITEQRRIDATLRQQAAALVDAARRKDQFLATLSHELRNPLQAIQAAVYVLGANTTPGAERARGVIERQTKQMWRLVDDLLEVSRIAEGKVELRPARIDARDVIAAAADTIRPQVEQRQQVLSLEAPDAPLVVQGDPDRLTQVVVNLLNNASKYTAEGGAITVAAHADNGHVVMRVRDDGVGIPADMLPRVFDLFVQVDAHRALAQGGLGLGLTLVQRLVDLHGGVVTAHSDGPGRGSEFVVRLPLAS